MTRGDVDGGAGNERIDAWGARLFAPGHGGPQAIPMPLSVVAALWVVALAAALAGSELLVRTVSALGTRFLWGAGLIGLLVALGADAPEITSALVALANGSADVGLGVILGSNIYNIAGLLGLSAVLGGSLSIGHQWLTREGLFNGGTMAMAIALVYLPGLHVFLGAVLVIGLLAYVVVIVRAPRGTPVLAPEPRPRTPSTPGALPSMRVTIALVMLGGAMILAGSLVVVQASLRLAPALGIPHFIVGTFVLAIATSLPNTWAAVSLSRRKQAAEAISATYNSNSINLVVGIGLPSLFFAYQTTSATRILDVGWLAGMTLIAGIFLALRHSLSRRDGAILIALYAFFVVARLLFLR